MDEVVAAVSANNVPAIPADHVRGFDSEADIDTFLLANPETVRDMAWLWERGRPRTDACCCK